MRFKHSINQSSDQAIKRQKCIGDLCKGLFFKIYSFFIPSLFLPDGFSEDAPPFQPGVPYQMPETQFQQSTGSNGNLDSPMAEFDADKRRMQQTHTGHSTTTRTQRRSRPVSQHIRDLLFWRNVKDSGVIFGFGLVLLLSLSYFSIISIFAYLSMTSLILITSFVLIKQITMAFQQQASEHPFKLVLDTDVVISPEYAHQQLDTLLKPLNGMLLRVRNLYLADSLGQTLKLIFVMYILTYVGELFRFQFSNQSINQ